MKTTECRFCQRDHAARTLSECPNVVRTEPIVRLGRALLRVHFKPELGIPPVEIDQPRRAPTHRGGARA